MYYIDTHTHLFLPIYGNNIKNVIDRALQVNKKMILPNIDLSTINKLFSLCDQYKNFLYPMLGIHPMYIDNNHKYLISKIEKIIYQKSKSICGIGEIGLDTFYNRKYFYNQKEAFLKQLQIAKNISKPVSIHCRHDYNELIDILKLKENKYLKGVVHCFSGNLMQANKLIELGFYLGIGGLLTFNNCHLSKIIHKININNIILETDSPYLSPYPFRGQQNESYNIIYVAHAIAKLQNKSINLIINITNKNVFNLFKI
ncbi:MAG: TatD family hydrolase [Bacteroides sp.]|nr:MAG: TatD family hydrolase [Bacteroides sp.]